MESASLIVMLALLEYLIFTMLVGAKRVPYGVEAPATVGHPVWERMFRVQQNTMEQLVVFVPATFAFAHYVSELWVWLPGTAFILGRLLYSTGYMAEPRRRVAGMGLTLAANFTLVIGTLIALISYWF